jgi:hypothetical protein
MMPMNSLLSGPRLYCWLSKVRWTCWGAAIHGKLFILLDVHLLAID